MRIKLGGREADGCETPTSPARREPARRIARRAAILLGGTAAMALSINQPATAISSAARPAGYAGR